MCEELIKRKDIMKVGDTVSFDDSNNTSFVFKIKKNDKKRRRQY